MVIGKNQDPSFQTGFWILICPKINFVWLEPFYCGVPTLLSNTRCFAVCTCMIFVLCAYSSTLWSTSTDDGSIRGRILTQHTKWWWTCHAEINLHTLKEVHTSEHLCTVHDFLLYLGQHRYFENYFTISVHYSDSFDTFKKKLKAYAYCILTYFLCYVHYVLILHYCIRCHHLPWALWWICLLGINL